MLIEALQNFLSFEILALMLMGVLLGTIFGSIPGLTTVMAIALLLPVTFYLDPMPAIALLLSVYCGGISGGLISAILLGIPGTPASIVSTFDGFPMAKAGKAGFALATGIFASFIGGILSAIALSLIAPLLSKIVIKFGPFEYFTLGICGLSMVASLSAGNTIKGLIAASLGIVIAMIGPDPVAGLPRFDFGVAELAEGISLIPALIGFFAISQALSDIEKINDKSKPVKVKISDFKIPIKQFIKSWFSIIRSGLIGIGVGLLPGVGTHVATFLSYNQAKQASKNKKEFGKGAVEGVIAAETTNNAVTGGALSCLITLGLPGDGATVALLGGLLIHGLRPGPVFMQEHPEIVYGIFIAFFIANIFMFLTQFWTIRLFAQILKVPHRILIPIIMVMCVIGAYAFNHRIFDVWTLFGFGVLGYIFKKFEFPLAPFILGFILGPIIEANMRRAVSLSGGDLMEIVHHPIAIIFLILSLVTVIIGFRSNK